MSSIGNDIVDLNAIDKQRTQQHQFYSKILSPAEQELYHKQPVKQIPFEVYVWLLWSIKESVYKFVKRLQPKRVFSPTRIEITSLSGSEFTEFKNFQNKLTTGFQSLEFCEFSISVNGKAFFNTLKDNKTVKNSDSDIQFQEKTYYSRSIITPQFIATVVNDQPDFENIRSAIQHIDQTDYESQSAAVRMLLSDGLKIHVPLDELQIEKSPVGYPVVLKNKQETDLKVSFAHHGNYVAYAYRLS